MKNFTIHVRTANGVNIRSRPIQGGQEDFEAHVRQATHFEVLTLPDYNDGVIIIREKVLRDSVIHIYPDIE
jgi:hypothetical protein